MIEEGAHQEFIVIIHDNNDNDCMAIQFIDKEF